MRRLVTAAMLLVVSAPSGSGLAQGNAAARHPSAAADRDAEAEQAPFPPLDAEAEHQLDRLLRKWEAESQGTQRLECVFTRWHFDPLQAPAGVPASWARGVIQYAAPDQWLLQVDLEKWLQGVEKGKPVYEAIPDRLGEHGWITSGEELRFFDRRNKQCWIRPRRGRQAAIFEIHLPLDLDVVFRPDVQQLRDHYWIREQRLPAERLPARLIEAWPKRPEDQRCYRLIRILLDAETFQPTAAVIYPRFGRPVDAAEREHYEFTNIRRNAPSQMNPEFLDAFDRRPPADWTTIDEKFEVVLQPSLHAAPPRAAKENAACR